ncbi:MAG TPA: hypothetical protein EYQ86_08220 [Bacteroidetes bacterium]|nr:hypothetical protein [Bacteroidota bacterium]
MSLPKEPRQQMINMMYLVLMALLAMNVSKSLLKAFGLVDQAMEKQNSATLVKIDNALSDIRIAFDRDSSKAEIRDIYQTSRAITSYSAEAKEDLKKLKQELSTMSGGLDDGSNYHGVKMLKLCESTEFAMLVLDVRKEGPRIRDQLNKTRKEWLAVVANMEGFKLGEDPDSLILQTSGIKLMAEIPEFIDEDGSKVPWHYNLVNGLPMAAVMPTLTQLEVALLNSEVEILTYLKSKIGIDEIRVDRVAPLIIPFSNYISPSEDYTADIFISAWNSTQKPVVYIGEIKTEFKEKFGIIDSVTEEVSAYRKMIIHEGESTWPLTEKNPIGVDSADIEANNSKAATTEDKYALALKSDAAGRGKFTTSAGSVGMKTYEGAIFMKKPNGDTECYLFDQNYGAQFQVASKADPVVSAMAMNVMYVGVDNPVSVSVPGYKPEDVQPSLGGSGSIKKGRYQKKECYIARVTKPGQKVKVNLTITEQDGKKTQVKGPEFRVKRVPDPVFTLGNKYKGGKIPAGKFRIQKGIVPKLENFDFEFRYRTQSYEMVYIPKGRDAIVIKGSGQAFDRKFLKYIKLAKPKDSYFFSDVKVKGDDKSVRKLPTTAFQII